MKILKITLIVLAFIGIVTIGGLWFVGYFSKFEIKEQQTGGYLLVGMDFIGPYMNVGPTMNAVDSVLRKSGIECNKGFGIYYDDPKKTPNEKCRSFVGNILENADSATINEIRNLGLKIDTLTTRQSSVIEWKISNPLSYMIGPMKVYPSFTKYLKDKTFTPELFIEVYDVPAKKIMYIMQHN